jgi:hypothetical protein
MKNEIKNTCLVFFIETKEVKVRGGKASLKK